MASTMGADLNPSRDDRPAAEAGSQPDGSRLVSSEQRYRDLIANSPVGQATYGMDGRMIEVNAAWAELLGYSVDEVIGEKAASFVHPDDRAPLTEIVEQLLAGEVDHVRAERKLCRKDGTWAWVSSSITLERDVEGQPQHFQSFIIDITERREAEEALRQSEARYRDVVDALHDGVVIHTLDGIDTANQAACQMLGCTVDELQAPDFFRTLDPIDADGNPIERKNMAHKTAIHDRRPVTDFVLGLVIPRRGRRWFNVNARPRLKGGDIIGAVVSFSDITEHKTTEDELRESETRFRTLAESLPVGVYNADATGTPVYVNPKWFTISEMDERDLLEVPRLALIHPDDREQVSRLLHETAYSQQPFHQQYRLVTPAGHTKWINARGAPVIDDEGTTTGYVGSIEDISPLVEAQEETARLASIVESTSDLVGVVDASTGTLLYMNRAGRRMLGYGEGTAGDTTVVEMFTDDAQTTVRDVVIPALSNGETWSGELAMRTADGQIVQVWQNMVGHRDNQGNLQRISALGRDVTERHRAAEALTHQATHDSLTDLPNRTLLLDELEDALAAARANDSLLALLFLDLDRFKGVNDRLGHDAGDELLVEAAHRISNVLRPGDLVARLGGDEFVVVCRDVTDETQATAIAQRITTALETEPIVIGAHELSITASVGVALSDGGFAHPESLLRDADAAMYRAKDLGRARLELFDESMRRRSMGRVEVAEELTVAIASGQIVVHYQPCISLTDGKVSSLEALARWDHPTRGLLNPKEFIEVAEETGQIVGLGLQVLTRACQQGRVWEELLGVEAPRIHVNLSARQLSASNIPDLVEGVLLRSGLSPHKLCLEITESVLMEDAAAVIDTLWALKALGIALAIDDFGTGYSSLSYLRKFPVDVIKVDQSFVDGLGPDPEDSAIVAAIIGLAHTLELEAIAEGVETAEQLERLRELGCHNAQGFMFAEPQPAEEITPLLTVFSAAERLRQR